MLKARNRGVKATLHHGGASCVWVGVDNDGNEFVRQRLHCADAKAGNVIPHPLCSLVHGSEVGDVLHFDYLRLRASDRMDGVWRPRRRVLGPVLTS